MHKLEVFDSSMYILLQFHARKKVKDVNERGFDELKKKICEKKCFFIIILYFPCIFIFPRAITIYLVTMFVIIYLKISKSIL